MHYPKSGSILEFASYMWQFYLPRLPFMHTVYFETYQLRDIWFNGFIGQFGWLDFRFPHWVYDWALAVALGAARAGDAGAGQAA